MSLAVLPNFQQPYDQHVKAWSTCVRCEIGRIAHSHVFARGTIPCDVLFVGEAPGKTEDLTGEPFVGKAGKLMDRWIAAASNCPRCHGRGVVREETCPRCLGEPLFTWAMTNTLLCRPCDVAGGPNRKPALQEATNCQNRLIDFVLNLARPRMLVSVGRVAAEHVPEWAGLKYLHLKHPAFYLRQQSDGLEEQKKLTEFLHRHTQLVTWSSGRGRPKTR